MTVTDDLLRLIKSPKSRVYRKIFIKRRVSGTGFFEDEWQDISSYVIKWGKISTNVDSVRLNTFQFGSVTVTLNNEEGKFNAHDDENSLWYGYLSQQRTLVKIVCGFINQTDNADGTIDLELLPSNTFWDEAYWDLGAYWDDQNQVFKGIIAGDLSLSDRNQVNLTVRPLNQVFVDYAATNLSGFTSTGITATKFCEILRDQTDVNGNYIFRPFFDDTTTSWDISTTSNIYANLNTSGAEDLKDKTCWDVLVKLSESENYIPYITKNGVFKFISRDVTTTSSFEFHGAGSFNSTYGQTIKSVMKFEKKLTKYYSRVEVKYRNEDTTTAYEIVQSDLEVAEDNAAWNLGQRTFSIQNFWIPTSTVAATIALNIFNDYSAIKNEIEFDTSFIPHLNILERVNIYYDPSPISQNSLWDLYNWADSSGAAETGQELMWDASKGNGIKLSGQEFRILSEEIDLDNFSNKYVMRRV